MPVWVSAFADPERAQFGVYREGEVKKLAVTNIHNPIVFDNLKRPVSNGLYDPRMGTHDRDQKCATCQKGHESCTGHYGRIELAVRIFHPLLLSTVVTLLRMACFECKRFRAPDATISTCIEMLRTAGDHAKSMGIMSPQEETLHLRQRRSNLKKKILEMLQMKGSSKCARCGHFGPAFRTKGNVKIFAVKMNVTKQDPSNGEDNKRRRFLSPTDVAERIGTLWESNHELLSQLFFIGPHTLQDSVKGWQCLFLSSVLVSPNRFRKPAASMADGGLIFFGEHPRNVSLGRVLEINHRLVALKEAGDAEGIVKSVVDLQQAVNGYYDSNLAPDLQPEVPGVRQNLDKKQGIFRMNMMGKRVNYAARSVISPDPSIATDEIGIPQHFAQLLTYPELVTSFNAQDMVRRIIRGPGGYPGANSVVEQSGRSRNLDRLSKAERVALAKTIMVGMHTDTAFEVLGSHTMPVTVHRHLESGDQVLVNRQPTLHKASIMAHRARVLPGRKTLRLHYANCSTYNADFDGDEMNVHLPQSDMTRSEAKYISQAVFQYNDPTNGEPLRGLIQDHVFGGTMLTLKNSFFDYGSFSQLVYAGTASMPRQGVPRVEPCILRPVPLYSGKQVIGAVLSTLAGTRPLLTYEGRCKVSQNVLHPFIEESHLVIDRGYICTGVLDKAHIGPSSHGLVHAVHEVYGPHDASALLSALGRLISVYIQMRGFTIGVGDMIVADSAEIKRRGILDTVDGAVNDSVCDLFNLGKGAATSDKVLRSAVRGAMSHSADAGARLDAAVSSKVSEQTSEVISALVPKGLIVPFPANNIFSMASCGARGSSVNLSQISCLLGQQTLEGRRVPVMAGGRSHPSFDPGSTAAMAGGYVASRFLTGLQPQEYFFHCMAGREGLVDTAVKTSRSGYLQRCVVKGLEDLVLGYDHTVRDSEGNVLQFVYGEDGLDVGKASYLQDLKLVEDNTESFSERFSASVSSANSTSLSEGYPMKVRDYARNRMQEASGNFERLALARFVRSRAEPGEGVGILAGQGIGKPSTQMTLNTFHLAGHGAANVTLGIPRLREILMTDSAHMSKPGMKLTLPNDISAGDAEQLRMALSPLSLFEVLKNANIEDEEATDNLGQPKRRYVISLDMASDIDVSKEVLEHRIAEFFQYVAQKVAKVAKMAGHIITMQKEVVDESDSDDEDGVSEAVDNAVSHQRAAPNDSKAILGHLVRQSHVQDVDVSTESPYIRLHIPSNIRVANLEELVKEAAQKILLRHVQSISRAFISVDGNGKQCINVEGVNLAEATRVCPLETANTLECNDINAVLQRYGVEAARSAIIQEVRGVFGHYGIQVDYRHLSLVADYLTFAGHIRPFSRQAMKSGASPLLRITFETATKFLVSAAEGMEVDDLLSPSSRIVTGLVPKIGTGVVSLRVSDGVVQQT